MRIACWIAKATDTHSEYVILTGFARQQWFYEIVSLPVLFKCSLDKIQASAG
jgi:hypothetical protein